MEKVVIEFRRIFDDKTSFMAIYKSTNYVSSRNTANFNNVIFFFL